jgi:hypothetical protein
MFDRNLLAAGLAAGEPVVLNGGVRPSLAEFEADPEGAFVIAAEELRGVLLDAATDPAQRADPRGLRLSGAALVGVLDLANFTLAHDLGFRDCLFVDAVSLAGAHIAGTVGFWRSQLNGQDANGWSLNAESLRADRDMFLGEEFVSVSAVSLAGAHIAGQLGLRGAELKGAEVGGWSLYAQSLRADGGVFLTDGFVSAGAVSLSAAQIAGQLSLRGAQLNGHDDGGWSLNAEGLQVEGTVLLDEGFVSGGAVSLSGAHIAGQLGMRGADLKGRDADGWSLNAEGLQVDGGVFLDDGFVSAGAVSLSGARVAGQLSMQGANLKGQDAAGWSLNARHSQLDGAVLLDQGYRAEGEVLLVGSQIRTLVIPEQGDLPTLGSVVGWRLGDLHGRPRQDRRAAARWLESQTTAQPWQELADLYDRIGQPSDARWIRYRSAVRSTRHSPWWSKVGRWLYRVTTGHGYYAAPLTLMWLVIIFAITWGMTASQADEFTTATSDTIRVAVASEPIVGGSEPRFDEASAVPGRVPTGWWTDAWDVPEFGAWNYAIATALPATGSAQPWSPPPGWLPAVFALLRGLSWVFTALFLAGITGLLRKQT